MPGKTRVQVVVDTSLCRRCQAVEPVLTVRTEPLCQACFVKYVATKIVKRMESFRVRNSDPSVQRTLLLPLSFGPCSTGLLHVLSQHRQGQVERTGRPGYKIHVLHAAEALEAGVTEPLIAELTRRYPDHVYSTIGLTDLLKGEDLTVVSEDGESASDPLDLTAFLASSKSATSRADVSRILLRKGITAFAQKHDCEAILWGDSTTRLAERTLAETAKGRGYSLPWIMAEGQSSSSLPSYYLVRDLLSKEMDQFAGYTTPPLHDIMVANDAKPATSTKNTTIDDLMNQYFVSVERDFPSIVANVVRTTGKLVAPIDVARHCELCELPLDGEAPEKSRLCYGCIRTLESNAG